MKKSMLWMRGSILLLLLASVLVAVIVLVGTAPPTFTIAQANPMTTVYLEAKSEYDYTSGSDPNNTWNNETNAWDQTDDTYANRTSNATEDNEANRIGGTGNTAPGAGVTITRVEIGVEHFCTNISVITKLKLRPVFGGANLGDVHEINSSASDTDSTDYVDITSDTNAPSPWNWSDIQNLDVRVWGNWTNPTVNETLFIDQIRVRVTHLPTIDGTAIGVNNKVTVNVMIRDAYQIRVWQAGLTFNATALECLEFKEGEFLSDVGKTLWKSGIINNTAGVITPHGAGLYGLEKNATGDGRLGYLTFKVKAPGVSDLHLHDVKVIKGYATEVQIQIIDVYTVVLDATPHTVVIVSNSTGRGYNPALNRTYGSGFYNHAFNLTLKQLSFNVTGPRPGFSNVTIPDTLLWGDFLVLIEGINASRTLTYNGTHFSLYFTYTAGIHEIVITTRPLISSTISIALSSATITLGESVTISGKVTPADNTTRAGVPITISYRPSGGTWTTFATVTTDSNSQYSYTWTQNKTGTYEFQAKWEGDKFPGTIGAESDVKILTVRGLPVAIYVFEVVVEGEAFPVVIESNFTVSNFAFNETLKEICFDITGLDSNTYVCNVTIPKGLLWCEDERDWVVKIGGVAILPDIAKNGTHTSMYFEHSASTHNVRITTRVSTISIDFGLTTIILGENVAISGTIVPLRVGANVTIVYRLNGGNWTLVATNRTTNEYGNYSYTWTPETVGTYELKARWDGDPYTNFAESDLLTLIVEEAPAGIPMEIVIVAVVAIVIIAAVAVYFVKFRKP